MARELFLTAPGPNRKVSVSGTTSTVVACLFSSTSNFSNQRVPPRVRAHAVSITPLVVAPRSLPCDKKVANGSGGGSSVTCSSVSSQLISSQLTNFTLAGQSLSSFQWSSCSHFAHGSLCLSLPILPCDLQMPPPFCAVLRWSKWPPLAGTRPPPLGQNTLLTVFDVREHLLAKRQLEELP